MTVTIKANVKLPKNVGIVRSHFESQLRAKLRALGKQTEYDLLRPTEQWESPPFMRSDIRGSAQVTMIVHPVTQVDKYQRLDFGTRPHVIRPRKANGVLKFQPGYSSSTYPNQLWSRRARRSGRFIYVKMVHHPGLKARNFSKQVAKIERPRLNMMMRQLVIDELTYARNHG